MISFLSVLVSRGYCHKAPQTRWLKPQRCIVSQSRSPRTRCPQDWFLPRGLPGRIRSLLLPKLLAIFGILRLIGAALQSLPSPSLGILPVYMSLVQISPFLLGFPGGASAKEPTGQCRRHKRVGSIHGSGRSPGGGNGNPAQYSCLANPLDRGVWWAV